MKREIKHRKYYNSPVMDEIIVDQEISMVMMSPPVDPGPDPWASRSSSSSSSTSIQNSFPSQENDPFGGNTVSY
ncbi:hypothetical protein [Saccharicrinis aurantiacus]|uniref:hypothetical protein n=1 Tax=Saccharicrinis aurantiacus TaxID=1849719 RepID=UPI001115421A|nr:hypothetical protein [Saccharicrinis aurantiacus]